MIDDIRLYLLNAGAFTVSMMDWLEPVLKIGLLLITIGYTAHKWWNLKNDKDETDK
jgi:hypothetical protein